MITTGPLQHCPKRMVLGPCGGVRPDGGCEVTPEAGCAFEGAVPAWPAEGAVPSWPPVGAVPAAVPVAVPLVLTDFTSEPYSVRPHRAVAATLAGSCDAVLVGEHHNRPDLRRCPSPSCCWTAGLRPWVTLACRDRNRVVLEQELAAARRPALRPCSA